MAYDSTTARQFAHELYLGTAGMGTWQGWPVYDTSTLKSLWDLKQAQIVGGGRAPSFDEEDRLRHQLQLLVAGWLADRAGTLESKRAIASSNFASTPPAPGAVQRLFDYPHTAPIVAASGDDLETALVALLDAWYPA